MGLLCLVLRVVQQAPGKGALLATTAESDSFHVVVFDAHWCAKSAADSLRPCCLHFVRRASLLQIQSGGWPSRLVCSGRSI